jgi:small subunit ribosomal protein S19
MARKRRVFRTAKMARRQARKRRSKISERRKKEFRWRGYSLGELQEMPLYPPDDDIDAPCIATLMPSRVKRTLARGLSPECEKLLERVRESNGKVVKTHCRGMYVLPEMVGSTIGVHDGQNFVKVEIVPNMIGHALGEFAKTRKSVTHTGPGVGATRSSQHVALK